MSKKNLSIIICAAVVLILAVGGWLWYQQTTAPKRFTAQKVSFKYPRTYETSKESATKTAHAERLVKLVNISPVAVIELNHETGAIIGANLTKSNFLDYLEKTATRALPLSYAEYKKLNDSRITVAGKAASRIDFTYKGKDKKTLLYMTLIIMTSGNDAYYFYAQSPNKDFWRQTIDTVQPSLVVKS